jgi:hypothetical protein
MFQLRSHAGSHTHVPRKGPTQQLRQLVALQTGGPCGPLWFLFS